MQHIIYITVAHVLQIQVNIANDDMGGHTGNLEATIVGCVAAVTVASQFCTLDMMLADTTEDEKCSTVVYIYILSFSSFSSLSKL